MKAVEIKNLVYTYTDGNQVLNSLNLAMKSSQKTAILGANGSGKTTLLYHLNGILLPQEGHVHIFGESISTRTRSKIRRRVGFLFDNPDHQLFSTRVFDDIAFGPRNLGIGEETVRYMVYEALEKIGLKGFEERSPYNLSWGQKKRVAIAGVLVMQPDILVCDEPFSGLDPVATRNILRIFDQLNMEGTTLIFSTHDVDIAYAWADGVAVLKQGQVLAAGGVTLLEDEALMQAAELEIPILAKVFQQTDVKPRTGEEAARMLQELLLKNKV